MTAHLNQLIAANVTVYMKVMKASLQAS